MAANDALKIQAVRDYLKECFPGAYVIHGMECDTRSQTFTIIHRDAVYNARTTHEFLAGLTPEEIKRRLIEWNLADRLLLAGESVVITAR